MELCGDILFSLYFCKELSEYLNLNKFNFNIQPNVIDPNNSNMQNHPNGKYRMTISAAKFLEDLLKSQSYINEVTFDEKIDERKYVNLDLFRTLPINFMSGDIRRWYYNLARMHLPADFTKPIINVEKNELFADKIILVYTERYKNITIDYNTLKPYKDHLIFFGLPYEYELFKREHFSLEYCPTKTALEAAKLIAGAKGFISNQGGLYSLAECMKVNRILISPEYLMYNNKLAPGPVNNHPQGGWHEVAATTEKMIDSLKELLK